MGCARAVIFVMQRALLTLAILIALALGIRALRRADSASPSARTPPGPCVTAIAPPPRLPDFTDTASAPSPAASVEPQAPATEPGRGIVGEWTGRPPVALHEFASKHVPQAPGSTWRLPVRLSADRLVYLLLKTHEPTEVDGGVFTGVVEDLSGSTAVMSYIGSAQAGVVLIPSEHRAFNFRSGDDGILRVTELDTLNAPDCGNENG